MVFPGSAGVSPAQKAARMAALPGDKRQEPHGIQSMSGYLGEGAYAEEMTRALISTFTGIGGSSLGVARRLSLCDNQAGSQTKAGEGYALVPRGC
jgi:hypothetical protein